MPDEFWFEVTSTIDVFAADGSTVIGRLQPNVPYRAMDANEHWLAIPGPNSSRGFVAIADLDYREIDAPAEMTAPAATAEAAKPAPTAVETEALPEVTAEETEDTSAIAETSETAEPVAASVGAADSINGGGSSTPDHGSIAEDSSTEDPPVAAPSDKDTPTGSHDTSAYLHASSDKEIEDEEADPSARQRRRRLIAGGAIGFVILLVIVLSTLGGESEPPTTVAATTTTIASTTTTTTTAAPPAVTTVPPVGTTPASATAPEDWRIVFYNDFDESRDAAFPVGQITGQATGSVVDGAYLVDIEGQRSMETLLQVPLTSRLAYFGATVTETRLEAGAHVCGLLFATNEELYVVTVNAEVTTGPREFAIVDSTGAEVLPVTGSTKVQQGTNHVAVLVNAPNLRLYINGEEVAYAQIEGNEFTGFGLTYGASSSGQCAFDDVEAWRPPVQPPTDGAAGEDVTDEVVANG